MLFTVLVWAAEQRANEFSMQGLANTAWAIATIQSPDETLFTAVARAVDRRMKEFSMQGIANTLECPNRAFRLRLGCA